MECYIYKVEHLTLYVYFPNTLYNLPHVQAVRYLATVARHHWESC